MCQIVDVKRKNIIDVSANGLVEICGIFTITVNGFVEKVCNYISLCYCIYGKFIKARAGSKLTCFFLGENPNN